MVKRSFCFLLALVLLTSAFSVVAFADNRDMIVYYAVGSKSAYRYHSTPDCPGLSRSTPGEITLEDAARRGYTPCSRCNPPAPDFDVSATPRPDTGGGGSGSSRTSSTPSPTPFVLPSYEPLPTFPSYSPLPKVPTPYPSFPRDARSTSGRNGAESAGAESSTGWNIIGAFFPFFAFVGVLFSIASLKKKR